LRLRLNQSRNVAPNAQGEIIAYTSGVSQSLIGGGAIEDRRSNNGA
jgi:hypothetical protein